MTGPEIDEPMLDALGKLERERAASIPAGLEDYVAGRRSAEDVLAEAPPEDRERVQAMLDALGPADPEAPRAWATRLTAQLEARAADRAEPEAEPPIDLAERRRSRVVVWTVAATAVAAAAVAVLTLMPRGQPAPEPDGDPPAVGTSLPSFTLTVRDSSVQTIRGEPDLSKPARYLPTSQIHWVLSPLRPQDGPLGVRVLAQDDQGARRLLTPAEPRRLDNGAIEIEGRLAQQLELPAGHWTLRFVVGEQASLPSDPAAVDRGGPWVVAEPAYVVHVTD
ncbi:MAG: hypothetical protein AAF799_28940 [Myxococcota bacterium]